jgi:hypothetical protein
MTVTTEYGKQNILAKETKARTPEEESYFITAERANGQLAMIGFTALLGVLAFVSLARMFCFPYSVVTVIKIK